MAQSVVKARKVGDSMVVTLTKPILETAKIDEGELLVLKVLSNGNILIGKETNKVGRLNQLDLEIDIVNRKIETKEAETRVAKWEYENGVSTIHPGIEDGGSAEATMLHLDYELSHARLERAEKNLERFEVTGDSGQD